MLMLTMEVEPPVRLHPDANCGGGRRAPSACPDLVQPHYQSILFSAEGGKTPPYGWALMLIVAEGDEPPPYGRALVRPLSKRMMVLAERRAPSVRPGLGPAAKQVDDGLGGETSPLRTAGPWSARYSV